MIEKEMDKIELKNSFIFVQNNGILFITIDYDLNLQMEQCALNNPNNCLNASIYSYLEKSGGQSSNLYLNAVHLFQHQC